MRLFNHRLHVFFVSSGWSLLELLIVLALLAIIASFAASALSSAWQRQSLHDQRQQLSQQIRYARLTSLQKKSTVNLCWSQSCGVESGLAIYLDSNADAQWQSTETLLSHWQPNKGVSFSFNRGFQISFNHAGNTAQSGTMVLCPVSSQAIDRVDDEGIGYALVLSSTGRLRETKSPCL